MVPRELKPRARRFLHRVSARLKLAVTFALLIITILLPRRADLLYVWPAAALLLLWALSGMPVVYALRRLLLAEVFIIGLALFSLFNPVSRPIVVGAVIKSNLCVLAMLILTWTTPFNDILHALRRLRFPAVMLTTLALMYRYLPVLTEESRRMQRARASRSFSRHRRFAWQNLANVIGQLFIRTADRAERIYLAMCARGWK